MKIIDNIYRISLSYMMKLLIKMMFRAIRYILYSPNLVGRHGRYVPHFADFYFFKPFFTMQKKLADLEFRLSKHF